MFAYEMRQEGREGEKPSSVYPFFLYKSKERQEGTNWRSRLQNKGCFRLQILLVQKQVDKMLQFQLKAGCSTVINENFLNII